MVRIAKLDCPHVDVKMYVSTDIEEQYRIKACAKEPWTCAWIKSMPPGSVLFDVGNNVGSYSLMAAALGHQVVAVEPSFANYARLCENVLLNDFGPLITPLCLALGATGHDCPLLEQELTPGYSGGAKRLRVPMLPLLDIPLLLGTPFPTHIKLDTDGHERQVVLGTEHLADELSWMVEVQDGEAARINALLGEPKAVFDTRNGQKIRGMHMALYER